jgi:hypothetical protein
MLACFVISKAKAAVALLGTVVPHTTKSGFAGYG